MMDENNMHVNERRSASNVNGSARRGTAPSNLPIQNQGTPQRPSSLMDSPTQHSGSYTIVQVIVNRDEKGYGMKVSGDNPVYVQSVKAGGAAEKAGLYAGDKIIEVNGENVMSSTHTHVVGLIRSATQVILTVQQRIRTKRIDSPSLHTRSATSPSPHQITGPQPVDHEKLQQFKLQKTRQLQLMIEKEERYLEQLRSQYVLTPNEKTLEDLEKTERNLQKLKGTLLGHVGPIEPLNHTHHRTKSSPESLLMMTPAEACRRLIASESMSDIRPPSYGQNATPPGTPPPPYPNASPEVTRRQSVNKDLDMDTTEDNVDLSFGSPSKDVSLNKMVGSADIHAASSQVAQQRIISMEDDEMSDQEVNQLDDHGPFKSLSRLWEHTPHLAVFMNYVLLNSDPNSLLFYLLTDLYKEGNAKDMRKWAYEIHSSFLVPGAPLRLANVDENIAHEIDDVLMREYDKEEILRKIFWKARNRAKEELTKQLNHFQQKRTAGLGTMYGPSDEKLFNMNHEKAREMKIYDTLLVDKLDPYVEEIDKENFDPKKYYTAAALATVIIRIFGVRVVAPLDRFPTFVNKEKSFRTKFMKYSRKLTIQGHQFNAQQYYTVIVCNHCHQIIYGIGPQGYQCSVCLINLHRTCVKLYDDSCPGPISKKDRSIQKVMEKIGHRGPKRKATPHSHSDRKQDEKDVDCLEVGDMKPNQSLSRTDSDRRPDAKTDNANQGSQEHIQDGEEAVTSMENTKSLPPFTDKKKNGSSINRSESVKESSEKQRKQRRNISDPLHNTSESGHIEATDLTWSGSTGSSSNTSINSNSRYSNESPTGGSAGCDSDGNIETDFLDWQSSLPEEELQRLSSHEKERQDIINELFHTERSHLRNLSILDRIFLKGIKEKSLLKEEEIQLVFPNLHEVLKIHSKFKCILKNKKIRDGKLWKNIGESLLTMFEGELGDTLQKVTATFCKNQQCALDLIKEKRRKDSKFNMGLNELEKNNDCRRLTLQGFIVSEMQRLAKYPLLIERLINIIEKAENSQDLEYSQMELNSLMRAHDRSKEILNHINDAAKRAWCKFRLEEIQNHLDTSLFLSNKDHAIVSEFKNIDLTNYNYVYDGPVHLKRQNKAHLQVHMVLLEEFVILLQRDSERYLLKFFQNGKPGQPPLAPIIKMSTLLVRTNAAFESSLFLVNTSAQSSMYELLTRDSAERKTWFTFLSNTVEAFKQPGGKTKSSEPLPDEEETVDELPNLQDAIERAETIGSSDTSGSEAEHGRNLESNPPNGEGSIEDKTDESSVEKEVSNDADSTGGGVSRKFTTEDWPLIQPSEVHADIPPVHSADIVLTPIEQIKRKGDEVSKAIDEKQNLCADVLNIDRKDFKIIADIASEANTRDPIDLVIASINQVDLIFKAVNESLTVTDVELIKGGMTPSCASQKNPNDLHRYPPEMSDIKEAATKLNRLLTELLEVVKDKDEDFLRLRKEQEKTREQLHARLSLECSAQNTDVIDNVPTEMTQTGDLESIEESLTENDMN